MRMIEPRRGDKNGVEHGPDMTNHEDLMAAALEAVKQAETRAGGAQSSVSEHGVAACLSTDEKGGADVDHLEQPGLDLDIDIDLDLDLSAADSSLPSFGKDLRDKLAAQKNALSDLPTLVGAKVREADRAQNAQNATSAVVAEAATCASAAPQPKQPQKLALPQIGAFHAAPNETKDAQAQSPAQAKCMMLENLVRAQKLRIATLENELDETRQKAQTSANAEIAELSAQNKALNDRIVRLSADFDNYRKRVLRDQEQNKEQAEERIVTGFLPVIDNLERALAHARQSKDFEKLLQGVEMTYRLYLQALGKLGCVPFESLGKSCDPNYHDVLQRVIDDEKEHNAIVQEHLKGYIMHERVLRPALVVVSQHSQKPETDSVEE